MGDMEKMRGEGTKNKGRGDAETDMDEDFKAMKGEMEGKMTQKVDEMAEMKTEKFMGMMKKVMMNEDLDESEMAMMDSLDDATKEHIHKMMEDMMYGMEDMMKDSDFDYFKGEDGKMKKEGKEKMMECMKKHKEDMDKKDMCGMMKDKMMRGKDDEVSDEDKEEMRGMMGDDDMERVRVEGEKNKGKGEDYKAMKDEMDRKIDEGVEAMGAKKKQMMEEMMEAAMFGEMEDMEGMEYSEEDMMNMFDDESTKEDMRKMMADTKDAMDKMEKDDRYNDWKGE